MFRVKRHTKTSHSRRPEPYERPRSIDRTTPWVLPSLTNSCIMFMMQLYRALYMAPIIDC